MRRLYRSSRDKMISGVCGGLGEYFGIDPTLLRLAWAALALFSFGTFLVPYVIAAVIIPYEGSRP